MTRRVRIKSKYRRPLDEDQIALAFLMLAKQLREEAEQDAEKNAEAKPTLKRRAA